MMPIDPELRIRGAALAVSDLARSTDFYEQIIGLPVRAREPDRVLLGTDTAQSSLELRAITEPSAAPAGSTGLFHVAWLHPTRASLAETVKRVVASGWSLDGASDHGVSEALYLSDPDGLGIELYADRPRELWDRPANGKGVTMVTLPLDIEDLLAQHEGEVSPVVEYRTHIGHVHLKVSDVPRAAAFYVDQLGFCEQARIPSAAFLSAGGYHHHIGLNSWQSHGGSPAPAGAPGLRSVDFCLSAASEVNAIAARVGESTGETPPVASTDGELNLRDPDGVPLRFVADHG